jgi:ABC-2 type transport system permease protein
LLALTIFTLGATFFFAAANVYYRDVAHILQIVLQVWFYVTPIIFDIKMFPAKYQWVFKLNPLIFVMNGFRLSVYYGMLPAAQSILASFLCAFISLGIGFAVFRKYQDEFVFYV